MRPQRLEIQGFASFRDRVVIDFEGADLFVLTGPIGSGKSSVIDAMVFALYGSVPRYGDKGLVYPAINQGKTEAKVLFEFSVQGTPYVAVRVVRRTKKGATTAEARLESNGRVLAGSATELTGAIEHLLGLSFEQFTKCVVLPQGEFARFLREKPKERQDLLVRLLSLDLYRRIGQTARQRNAEAKQRMAVIEEQLEGHSDATVERKRTLDRRVTQLEKLLAQVDKVQPKLAKLETEIAKAEQDAEQAEEEAERLEAIETPRGVQKLADALRTASADLMKHEKAAEVAEGRVEKARDARAKLTNADDLRALLRLSGEREDEQAELDRATKELKRAKSGLDQRAKAVAEATRKAEQAEAALDETKHALAATEIAAHLHVGEPCPVCLQTLERKPRRRAAPKLATAKRALELARKALAAADGDHRKAGDQHARVEQKAKGIRKRIKGLDAKLKKSPTSTVIEQRLEAIEEADLALDRAQRAATAAHRDQRSAHSKVEAARGREREAWSSFDDVRDELASLRPPAAKRKDIARAWSELVAWSQEKAPQRRYAIEIATTKAAKLDTERGEISRKLSAACEDANVEVDEQPRDACLEALAETRADASRVGKALERVAQLNARLSEAREKADVAATLGKHLDARGFERWLLDEAFARLVGGASEILRELSSGQYSLAHDEKLNFDVIDHVNADEHRSAKTLSGGETFLASLSLALTLAEQVSEMSAEGAARFESIFLDEGFGSLDPDTLDVVVTAIDELGARGRTVGLITHVRDLAERISIQYRVSKGPTTSTVERITV